MLHIFKNFSFLLNESKNKNILLCIKWLKEEKNRYCSLDPPFKLQHVNQENQNEHDKN